MPSSQRQRSETWLWRHEGGVGTLLFVRLQLYYVYDAARLQRCFLRDIQAEALTCIQSHPQFAQSRQVAMLGSYPMHRFVSVQN